MATYTPSTPISHIGRGGSPPVPPGGGGDDDRGAGGPNDGALLRRARLGLICAMVTGSMVFIALTSAYIVRQGLPTYDNGSNTYIRDWGEVQLPWVLLAINTALLVFSCGSMDMARRSS